MNYIANKIRSWINHVAKRSFLKLSFIILGIASTVWFMMIALTGSLFVISMETRAVSAKSNAEWIISPNQPIGTARGIFPGRVVWVHDPAVATWDGTTGNWWDENVTSQSEADKMLKESLTTLTGEKTEKKA